jgi:hypothetical protein
MLNASKSRLFLVVSMALMTVASFAQTTGGTTGGGEVVQPDWAAAATSVGSGTTTMVQGIFPTLATIMVVFLGVRIFPKLIKIFTK